jgi:ABC-type branched-subunit amino acid transport system substrate-binding protein
LERSVLWERAGSRLIRVASKLAPTDSNHAEPQQKNPKSSIENPKSKIVLLATTDHESRMTAREVVRELGRRGAAPAFRCDLPPGGVPDDGWLRAAGATPPAAVLVIAGAEDAARLTRTLREALGAVPVFGGQSMGRSRFLALAGPAAEGVRFPLLFAPGPADEAAARFIALFRAGRGHDPDYAAALAYDATHLLIAAIQRAGPNRARIRTELGRPNPWPGLAGPIRFDGTGQNRRTGLALGTVRQGAVVAVTGPAAPAATLGFAPVR